MHKMLASLTTGLMITCLMVSGATAAVVNFEGSVNFVDPSLSSEFNTTMTMTGSFEVDEFNPINIFANTTRYPTSSLLVSIGGSYTGTHGSGGFIDVTDSPGFDNITYADFDLQSGGTFANVAGLRAWAFSLRLDDDSGTALNSTAFPSSINLADFPNIFNWALGFEDSQRNFFNVRGNLTSISVSPTTVALPAALPLFAGGLGFLGLLGWRRKRTKA